MSAVVLFVWAATTSLADSAIMLWFLIIILFLLLLLGLLLVVRGSIDLIRDLRRLRSAEPRNHLT
jgi:hypothetical protein